MHVPETTKSLVNTGAPSKSIPAGHVLNDSILNDSILNDSILNDSIVTVIVTVTSGDRREVRSKREGRL